MTTGQTLRLARTQAGLSQLAVDKRCGFPRGTTGRYECGRREPSVTLAAKICKAMGASMAIFDPR